MKVSKTCEYSQKFLVKVGSYIYLCSNPAIPQYISWLWKQDHSKHISQFFSVKLGTDWSRQAETQISQECSTPKLRMRSITMVALSLHVYSWRAQRTSTLSKIVIPCSTAARLVLDGAEIKQTKDINSSQLVNSCSTAAKLMLEGAPWLINRYSKSNDVCVYCVNIWSEGKRVEIEQSTQKNLLLHSRCQAEIFLRRHGLHCWHGSHALTFMTRTRRMELKPKLGVSRPE